ncbi:MAG TPA: putative Ig domain-containing protein, partial [Clostridia bacterium]|nr:putative Ig domain-containing protein [Clostridia bacterium]
FGGYPAPTCGISTDKPNTANATFAGTTLTIPSGLNEGMYTVTLTATNLAGTMPKTITVNVYPMITINFVTDIEFRLSSDDNKIVASGGAGGPYTFTLASGAMPAGLTLNSDGTITGTAAPGVYAPVTVRVTDRLGNSMTTNGLAVNVIN